MRRKKWKVFPIILALAMVLESTLESVGNWSVSEVQAASKPGEASYYAERWAECEAKVSWTETGLTEWSGNTTGTQPTKGAGTSDSPYEVTNADELRWCMANQKSCKLMKDIDLGGRSGKNWTGINITSAMTLDGNGKTIYNLYSVAGREAGFIGRASNINFNRRFNDD